LLYISYADSINFALKKILEDVPESVLIGQGVTSPWYVGSTTRGLIDKFGAERVIDTPVSEEGVTGAAIGMALADLKPIVMHPRMDFMLLAFNPIINQAANWRFMFGGRSSVPMVVWSIINRGGEQGAQHSQALHAMMAHVPGLKVVAPSSPRNVLGLFWSAIFDPDPVVIIDDRWLYRLYGDVPSQPFLWPIGVADVVRHGAELSVFASSWLSHLAKFAVHHAKKNFEVVDLVSLKPLDEDAIITSVQKTGRALILDGGWRSCGFAAEVAAVIAEYDQAIQVRRLTLPDSPAPAATWRERNYYVSVEKVVDAFEWFDF